MSDYHPKTVGGFRQAIRDTGQVLAFCPVMADYVRVTKAASLDLVRGLHREEAITLDARVTYDTVYLDTKPARTPTIV